MTVRDGELPNPADEMNPGRRGGGGADNAVPMDTSPAVNWAARFKSNAALVFDVHPSQSAGTGCNISRFHHLTRLPAAAGSRSWNSH